jgi:hypothetical protein
MALGCEPKKARPWALGDASNRASNKMLSFRLEKELKTLSNVTYNLC